MVDGLREVYSAFRQLSIFSTTAMSVDGADICADLSAARSATVAPA